jgi:endonuclease YncB( thermonuclease family)
MIRALLLGSLGAASFVAVYLLMSPNGVSTNAPGALIPPQGPQLPAALGSKSAEDVSVLTGFELRPGPEAMKFEERTVQQAIRDVTPNTMTAGPRMTGTLARSNPSPAGAKARTERLFNPIVIAAGTIKARNREIHLAGIAAPDFEKMCGQGATAWPCGRLARAALRSFIHSRAIECEIPPGADKIPDPADCLVAGDSMSEWLVAHGWAKRRGDHYAAVESIARQAKLGLWSDKRPDVQGTAVAAGGD